jgi:hypothetical protein
MRFMFWYMYTSCSCACRRWESIEKYNSTFLISRGPMRRTAHLHMDLIISKCNIKKSWSLKIYKTMCHFWGGYKRFFSTVKCIKNDFAFDSHISNKSSQIFSQRRRKKNNRYETVVSTIATHAFSCFVLRLKGRYKAEGTN